MDEMVNHISSENVTLNSIVELALSDQQPYARFSAWIVNHYLMQNGANKIYSYCDKAIDQLHKIKHDGQLREILRWFSRVDYKGKKEGELIDFCFNMIMNISKPVAIKIHSMTILEKSVEREPELKREFALILEDILPYLSAGGQNRTKKLLKKYSKELKDL